MCLSVKILTLTHHLCLTDLDIGPWGQNGGNQDSPECGESESQIYFYDKQFCAMHFLEVLTFGYLMNKFEFS